MEETVHVQGQKIYGNSVQCCCEPKTAFKNKVYVFLKFIQSFSLKKLNIFYYR
jgi:hypothetical protein